MANYLRKALSTRHYGLSTKDLRPMTISHCLVHSFLIDPINRVNTITSVNCVNRIIRRNMGRILTFMVFLLLTTPPLFAQYEEEDYTEEEAIQLIAAYQARESEANEMVEEELVKIGSLRKQLAEVEKEISEIEEMLKEIRKEFED